MQAEYEVVVIGAGMMGSAAARYIAKSGQSVALIGPGEPIDKTTHSGVFASHYDQARITRALDENADWSAFSMASIQRYAEVEQRSEIRFFHEVGSIMAGPEHGPGSDFIQNTKRVGQEHNIAFEDLRGAALTEAFPFFAFPEGMIALYEAKGAGFINPRDHVAAQITAARKDGAVTHQTEVIQVEERAGYALVHCRDGTQVKAQKIIIACGGFSKADALLPEDISLKVYARTVAFLELGTEEAERLNSMPSLVYLSPDQTCDVYILPPVLYPDGKIYLKIGGDPKDIELESLADIKSWFQGGGNAKNGDFLAAQLLDLMPGLRYNAITTGSCVTSYTDTGKPLIYPQTDRVIALTGGNGMGAKCADEFGRLSAQLAQSGQISGNPYATDFRP